MTVIKVSPADIFSIQNTSDFENIALEIFRSQAENCKVYKEFVNNLRIQIPDVKTISDIPFLPIEFFKSHDIINGRGTVQEVFTSSGTTGTVQSKHSVLSTEMYVKSFRTAFEIYYGDIKKYPELQTLQQEHIRPKTQQMTEDKPNFNTIYVDGKKFDEYVQDALSDNKKRKYDIMKKIAQYGLIAILLGTA